MKISIISLIIALSVAILSLFQFEKYQRLNAKLDDSLKKISVAKTAQPTPNFEAALNVFKENENNRLTAIDQKINQLDQQLSNLSRDSSAQHWEVTEAYRLIKLANLRLQTSNDLTGALILLKSADRNFLSLKDPNFIPLHEQLTQDIRRLESIQPADINKVWLDIGQLIHNVNELPTRGIRMPDAEDDPSHVASEQAKPSASFKDTLAKTWREFKDLIKIQRHTKPIEPILSTEEQVLAHQHLSLILEQMRWAVLNQDVVVYQHSIEEAQHWLNTYFEETNPQVQAYLKDLNVLSTVTLKPEIPNLDPLIHRFEEKGIV